MLVHRLSPGTTYGTDSYAVGSLSQMIQQSLFSQRDKHVVVSLSGTLPVPILKG